ncbi:MAG: hypothetical protein AAF429_10400 [Pseudomonadota bacterium]
MIRALRFLLRMALLLGCLALVYFAATYKPLRVVVPNLAPVECITDQICIDDPNRAAEATRLYREALAFVNTEVGEIENPPRAYFCAGKVCSDYFGLGKVAAYAASTRGIVIKPNGWKDYIVRHELIHHLQAERLGSVGLFLRPEWFREGMAYSLSRDPRRPLPAQFGLETLRANFEAWYAGIKPEDIWTEAQKLTRDQKNLPSN